MEFLQFLPILLSFVLSRILCPLFIPLLRRMKFGQQIRSEGNPEHLKKQGTPTIGALAFLPAIVLTSVLFLVLFPEYAKELLPVLLVTVVFAVIGFADDFLKVVKKQSEGFNPAQKFLCQLIAAGLFAWYAWKTVGTEVLIPFTGGKTWDMGWLYIPFVIVAVLGTDNGTNFTDGLDGLLSSVTTVVALLLFLAAGKAHGGVQVVSGAVAGALMGFLFVNSHPAKVFMGDTGSLAIGGFVASAAVMMRMGWFILIFGLIYVIEVVSVILQVGYFKLTHGKRLFKMAPIHHHFELKGRSETQIVTMFTIFTVLLSFAAYLAM